MKRTNEELGRFYNVHVSKTRPIKKIENCFRVTIDEATGACACGAWSTVTRLRRFTEPPPIGMRVELTMNLMGCGTVEGYFIEDGYIGVVVKPESPPKWWTDRNPGRTHYMVFGTEIAPLLQSEEAFNDLLSACEAFLNRELGDEAVMHAENQIKIAVRKVKGLR